MHQILLSHLQSHDHKLLHDVRNTVHALGNQMSTGSYIASCDATFCHITDNADLLEMHRTIMVSFNPLWATVRNFAELAQKMLLVSR